MAKKLKDIGKRNDFEKKNIVVYGSILSFEQLRIKMLDQLNNFKNEPGYNGEVHQDDRDKIDDLIDRITETFWIDD